MGFQSYKINTTQSPNKHHFVIFVIVCNKIKITIYNTYTLVKIVMSKLQLKLKVLTKTEKEFFPLDIIRIGLLEIRFLHHSM